MKRRWFFLLTLVFLAGLLAFDVAVYLRPDRLRAMVDEELGRNVLADFRYRDIGFSGLGVAIEDVVVFRGRGTDEPAFECDRVRIGLDLGALLDGALAVRRISLDRPVIHLRFDEQGELELPKLFESSATKPRAVSIPDVDVTDLSVRLHGAPVFDRGRDVEIARVNIDLEHRRGSPRPYEFSGRIQDPILGDFGIRGRFGDAGFDGWLTSAGFRVGPELVSILSEELRRVLEPLRFDGGFELDVAVRSRDLLDTFDFSLDVRASDLGVVHDRYPGLEGRVLGAVRLERGRLVSDFLQLELASARADVERFVITLGEGGEAAAEATAQVRDLLIDENFLDSISGLPEPFPDIHDALTALGVRGRTDLELELAWPDPFGRVAVDVVARLEGVSLAYEGWPDPEAEEPTAGFPYRIDDVWGVMRIGNDRLDAPDLRSRSADQDVGITGWVNYGRRLLAYDVHVAGRHLPVDERVRLALPPDDRGILDSYHPEGWIDVDVAVRREAGASTDEADVTVVIDLDLDRARPEVLPLELEDVEGRLVFRSGKPAELKGIVANRGAGTLELGGSVELVAGGEAASFDLTVDARDLDLDPKLIEALDVEFPGLASELRTRDFRGPFDLKGSVVSGSAEEFAFDVAMKGLSFRLEELPGTRLEDLRGGLEVRGERLVLKESSLRVGGQRFDLAGWIEAGERESWDLALRSDRLVVGDEIVAVAAGVSDTVADLEKLFRISGDAGFGLTLRRLDGRDWVEARLLAAGLDFEARRAGLSLRAVRGELRAWTDEVRLDGLTAVVPYGEGWERDAAERAELTLESASLGLGEEGPDLVMTGLLLDNLVLRDEVVAALPERIAAAFRDLGIRGRADVALGKVRHREGRTVAEGELRVENLGLGTAVPVVLDSGAVVVDAFTVENGAFRLEGELRDVDARIGAFPYEGLRANLLLDDRHLELSRMRGRFCGGTTGDDEKTSRLLVRFEEGTPFDLAFVLTEADLGEFLRTVGARRDAILGRANAFGGLSGRFDDLASFRGEAEVRMRGRQLYELPLFALVFQIVNFDFLTESRDAAQSGEVVVTIADSQARIERAVFKGKGIDMTGSGSIGFDGIIDLSFEPKPIKWVDQIPIVGDLFEIGSGIIVDTVELSGPIESPRARVGNYFTEILPSTPDSGRRLVIRPVKEDDEGAPPPEEKEPPR